MKSAMKNNDPMQSIDPVRSINTMGTIDAHCHLDQLDDPAAAIARALGAGVTRIVTVSEDLASMKKALALRKAHPGTVLAGLGIHPARSVALSKEDCKREVAFIESHLGDADLLGEVGLDFKHAATESQQKDQAELFDRLLEIAADHGKPVNIHSRRAQRAAMERAVRFTAKTGLGALMHWFTASKKLIRICAAEGVFVSVGPSVLFHDQTREVAATIPLDLLLVETDSPVPYGGTPAEPAWAARVTREMARIAGLSVRDLAERVARNLDRFLREKV